ncbi:MAG: DMT family transporter [Xanthobacteraceae bacterium]|jgi:drug/metabolite transporter (DMT)-like permease
MDVVKGILLKLVSALLFSIMSALIRWLGEIVPLGQVVFFRSAFAIVPVVIIYALRGELTTAVRTGRPFGHFGRGLVGIAGMFLSFAALARLPLANATAIGFAAPLITVALAALVLKERVRVYRWSAVGVGFVGVLVMLVPYLDLSSSAAGGSTQTIGAVLGLAAAFCNAGSVIQTRRLTDSETTSAIVLYFSLICAVGGLLTLPFDWHRPTGQELAALIAIGMIGGVSHLLLTESYRFAPTSVVAPFDYTSIFWAFVLGYAMFGEVPSALVFVGAAIIALAGLFVIWRERQLGIGRSRIRTG